MGICNIINGITATTAQNFLLDAGAFFKNFDVDTDTVETAKTEGKLIGATKGGGVFRAVPTWRTIEVDGARGKVKGTEILDEWEVTLEANVIEVTTETIGLALAVVESADVKDGKYTKLEGRNCVQLSDYIDNITWVGTKSGSNDPVIIQVYNALNNKGLELTIEDKNEGVVPLAFTGYQDGSDTSKPPFGIFVPADSVEVPGA